MSVILGIDLGTTNSLAAVWQNNEAVLIPNSLGERLTPSCVSVDDDDSLLIGRAAYERLITHPDRSVANFKRHMGSARRLKLGGLTFRPEELSSLVLKSLKADAEAFLGIEVRDAVIAVPAYFSDKQRKATKVAGELAGLNVLRLVNEPTAAALAYGVHEREGERKFLIFDLGGGTFDVSVLDYFEGVMEVRASTGDNFLGGEDFTHAIADLIRERLRIGADELSPIDAQRLHAHAEGIKRRSSVNGATRVEADIALSDDTSPFAVDASELEHAFDPLVQRLRDPVERALRDSRIPVGSLDDIILVGGASRMPVVRKLVSRMFGRFPASHLNPDEVVALGTAVQAGLLARDAGLSEMVLTDVAPYSLGIETAMRVATGDLVPGQFLPIIERNTIVPVSRVQRIYTIRDSQEHLDIQVYQGESRLTRDNVPLGDFTVGVPVMPAQQAGADVRFTYDVSGVLEVEAQPFPTGELRSLVIEETPGVMTEEQIRERLGVLAALKIHPRDQMENRALLARADRIYEESLGEERRHLTMHIAQFQAVLERQDALAITDGRSQLKQVLDSVDTRRIW